jgi:hypothetical protein
MLCVSNRDAAMFATQRRGLSLEASWDWDLGQRQVWVSRTCSRKASYLSFNYTILHKPGVDSENAMKKMAQPQDHQPISTYINLYQAISTSNPLACFPYVSPYGICPPPIRAFCRSSLARAFTSCSRPQKVWGNPPKWVNTYIYNVYTYI